MNRMPPAVEMDVVVGPKAEGARRATGAFGPTTTSAATAPDPEVPAKAQRRRFTALLQHEPLRRSDPMKADLSDRCCRTPVDRARSSDSRRCTRAASQSAARLASGLADRLR